MLNSMMSEDHLHFQFLNRGVVMLGVFEIVTTSQKVNYRPELENVCKALEAVDLKSSDILSPPNIEDRNESYQAALMEIRNVLKCVCDTHKLPLAQTWAPCIQQGKGGCRHSDRELYTMCFDSRFCLLCPLITKFLRFRGMF
ncbi:UNVERIFIED_CONTAM: protein NLP4 [Sesamum angustifolium]|uniref:Protein NLP4 n=1 Tax=Sesamum angustifolium TaxID=2727405 RepID=A0AAW2QD53_9LAMI